jgi:hypothetical protein
VPEEFTQDGKRLDILIHETFILGLPGETPETIEHTIRYALELRPIQSEGKCNLTPAGSGVRQPGDKGASQRAILPTERMAGPQERLRSRTARFPAS